MPENLARVPNQESPTLPWDSTQTKKNETKMAKYDYPEAKVFAPCKSFVFHKDSSDN